VALLDPGSAEIQLVDADTCDFLPYEPESPELPVSRSSSDWYSGRAEHLRCARIDARSALEPRVHVPPAGPSP